MDFTVEFYVSVNGRCPVQEFLDELKQSDPGDLDTAWTRMRDWLQRHGK